jgi:hypothetical protein
MYTIRNIEGKDRKRRMDTRIVYSTSTSLSYLYV